MTTTATATAAAGTIFADHLVSGPYERVFFEPGQELQYIRNYLDYLDGTVEYDFRIAEYFNLRVVGLQSPLGHVSLVAIGSEDRKKLPDFIQETKILFVVDSIDAVYAVAEANGIPVLQPRTENIMGAQGRLELAPGYIVELAETTNESLFHPDVDSLGLPPSRR
ncbi:hypothetical protein [Streptomyces sp. NBC_00236]|uniref:hypothetical protein n=1 Tax=unclassified Streptomyces TaxID=2593676 RepID=UPI002E2C8ED2|nr:hypothetical protein [Streptomyces sp. NBC_00236]